MDNEIIQNLISRIESLESQVSRDSFSAEEIYRKYINVANRFKIPVVSTNPTIGNIGDIVCVVTTFKICTVASTTAPTWTALLSGTGDGSALTGISTLKNTFTAGPQCIAGKVVCAGPYQSDGGVTLDAKTVTNNTKSFSFTVGSNSNRILVLIALNTTGNVFTVTYNGVSMTNVQNSGYYGYNAVFYLVAPDTGSHTIATSSTDAAAGFYWSVYSYYNAAQTGQPDFSAKQTNPSGYSQNVVTDGCLVVGAGVANGVTVSGTSYTYNIQTTAFTQIDSGDSGVVFPAGQAVTITATSGGTAVGYLFGIAPFTTVSEFVIQPASASNVNNQFFKPYNNIVGIVPSTINAGASGNVILNGVATGLSGLSDTIKTYYLSDTAGAVATTAGTNSKKIGINLSTSTLLLQLS